MTTAAISARSRRASPPPASATRKPPSATIVATIQPTASAGTSGASAPRKTPTSEPSGHSPCSSCPTWNAYRIHGAASASDAALTAPTATTPPSVRQSRRRAHTAAAPHPIAPKRTPFGKYVWTDTIAATSAKANVVRRGFSTKAHSAPSARPMVIAPAP